MDASGLRAAALTGQAGQAEAAALGQKFGDATAVIQGARGQQVTALSGLQSAADIAQSGYVSRARAKQMKRDALRRNIFDAAGIVAGRARANKATGGTFWRPNVSPDPNKRKLGSVFSGWVDQVF